MKFKLLISVLLVWLVVVVPGCVYFNLQTSPQPSSTIVPSPINPDWVPPVMDTQTPPTVPDFISAIAKVRPSVVAVNTTLPGLSVLGSAQGAGSGWIIDPSGLIVTNNHVVAGAQSITVTLDDGRTFAAALVRTDPLTDLAVIKINAPNLQAVKVGDSSNLKVGEWVAALGNSLGQGISATKGIVSALGVSVSAASGENLYDLIQTDAAINPGNSGGPLINLLGEVEGITSIKVSQVGIEGMGYAISTEEALPVITDLIKLGYAIHPWIGTSLYTVNQLVVLRYSLSVNQGALVTQVVSGSPADKAGIKVGDVITAIDGHVVASAYDVETLFHNYQVGQQVEITYYRGKTPTTVPITLAASPP